MFCGDKFCGDKFGDDMFCMGSNSYILEESLKNKSKCPILIFVKSFPHTFLTF